MHEAEKQIPIWFFIGCMLAIYGVMILCSGVYNVICPPEHPVALSHLHSDVWWGGLLILIGMIYVLKYRPRKEIKN